MTRFALCFFIAGCTGVILPANERGERDPGDPREDLPPAGTPFVPGSERPECESARCAGATPLVRLTRAEYLRGIEAAFSVALDFDEQRLPADGVVAEHFASNAGVEAGNMVESKARALQDSADALATILASSVSLSCNPAIDAGACGREVFDRYAPSLYRGAVDSSWGDAYAGLYAETYADEGADVALNITLSTMLQSPHFIYREERSPETEAGALDGLAIASRLASFLWRGSPDAELREAAVRGELDAPEGVRRQAQRMLDDPKADKAVQLFHEQWLALDEIELDEQLADSMRQETLGFVVRAFRESWDLNQLMTDTSSDVDERLAEHYGVTAGAGVEVPGRVGLLTHAAVLSAHTGEPVGRQIHRGDFLISDVLCRSLGEIPDDVDTSVLEDVAMALGPDATPREQLEAATGSAPCNGCHAQINPAGFAFDAFDGEGRFLGDGLDTAGTLLVDDVAETYVSFDDHRTLVEGLLETGGLSSCYAHQWLRFALGREPTSADATSVWDVQQHFLDEGYSLRELLLGIVTTDAFLSRAAPLPDEAPRCD